MQLLHRQRNRRDFLHEFCADLVCDSPSSRARQEDTCIVAINSCIGFHPLQEFQRLFRLLGFMALIILPEHLVCSSIDHYRFHRGRAHVKSDQELGVVIVWLLRRFRLLNGRSLGFEGSDLDQLSALMIVHYFLFLLLRTRRGLNNP